MDFTLSTETNILKNSAERYLREKCPTSFVKDCLAGEEGFSRAVWNEIAELGWLGLVYDERYGGSNGSFYDLFTLFVEIGKTVLPSPFFTSAVMSGLVIAEAGDEGQQEQLLPPLIGGDKIWTLALLDENGRYDFEQPGLEAKETGGGGYQLNGTRLLVEYAHVADHVLVCANATGGSGSGPTLFRVDRGAGGMATTALETLTQEKTFAVTFDNVEVPADAVIGQLGEGAIYIQCMLPRAIVLKCGEMLGGLERVVDMTVEYVKERKQFGKPLGTLQVVHHYCADMHTDLMGAKLIAGQAASLLSEGVPCEKEVAMAKAWCSDVYKKCTWTAHQLHGGIGFTEEHDLHLYYKHAKVSELMFGSSVQHRSVVADQMGI
jgi:alkylation response protein AidB-like acyl-CoA dehydrogenase